MGIYPANTQLLEFAGMHRKPAVFSLFANKCMIYNNSNNKWERIL